MSKLMCGRCGDKVNVNLVPSEYRTQDGVIYCDDYCFKYKNNKRPPKTISVKQDAKLYVVNEANELISLRDKLGFDKDDNNIENLILVKSFINDNKQFYNKYKNYNIIEVIYYIPEDTISNIKFFIDKILDASKR